MKVCYTCKKGSSLNIKDDILKTNAMYISWLEWRLGDSLGISE